MIFANKLGVSSLIDESEKQLRPNIILIMSDDQGFETVELTEGNPIGHRLKPQPEDIKIHCFSFSPLSVILFLVNQETIIMVKRLISIEKVLNGNCTPNSGSFMG